MILDCLDESFEVIFLTLHSWCHCPTCLNYVCVQHRASSYELHKAFAYGLHRAFVYGLRRAFVCVPHTACVCVQCRATLVLTEYHIGLPHSLTAKKRKWKNYKKIVYWHFIQSLVFAMANSILKSVNARISSNQWKA